MAAIDIGIKVVSDSSRGSGTTRVNKDNPANLTGKITTIDIEVKSGGVTGLIVAIFENVGGNNLTARSAQLIGDLAEGLHEGISVDLDVVAGDYIGSYHVSGYLWGNGGAGAGEWYLDGDHTECVSETFSAWTNVTYLWGDGAEPGAGGSRGFIIG